MEEAWVLECFLLRTLYSDTEARTYDSHQTHEASSTRSDVLLTKILHLPLTLASRDALKEKPAAAIPKTHPDFMDG